MKNKHGLKLLTSAIGLAVVFGILVAIQIIVQKVTLRKDLTEEKLYTLSTGTLTLLKGLDRDVTLKFYYSKSVEGLPMAFKQYAQRLQDLLREYKANGGGRLTVETYDPKPDSDEEEWAQRYGLAGQGLDMLGGGPRIYLGLVAVSGSRDEEIPFIAPGDEPRIEYEVTRLIGRVLQAQRPQLALMSTLPVMGEPAPYGPQAGKQPWALVSELQKQYEVMPLSPDVTEIPTNVDTLVVIHPKDFHDATLFAIDQFVLRGGRLMVFEDPLCLAAQETLEENTRGMMGPSASDLNRLTKAWGAELIPGSVVADLNMASQVKRGAGVVERMPFWLTLRGKAINGEDVATSSLKLLMMPFAGSFQLTPTNGIQETVLVKTSADAGAVNSFTAMAGGAEAMKGFEKKGELPLAVRLQGHFKTAFPDGRPKSDGEGKNESPAPSMSPALKESAKPSVVVLVADADLLYDRFCVRGMQIFGQTFYEPANNNLDFAFNQMEQLAGNEALIGLRSRGTYDRPFTRVLALESQAQERWQREEQNLQAKLRETQMHLNQLQAVKTEDQQYILSPDQKKEIETFRQQQFQTQQELKEVRKNLRRDIENLGLKLKIINMALIPALVAVFGIFFWLHRKKRASA
jgi:ABC-type uncharacterized transport system involved in gliding motility auxiliary subunit